MPLIGSEPVLNERIETTYRNNPTRQIAGVRILQALAELNGAIGSINI